MLEDSPSILEPNSVLNGNLGSMNDSVWQSGTAQNGRGPSVAGLVNLSEVSVLAEIGCHGASSPFERTPSPLLGHRSNSPFPSRPGSSLSDSSGAGVPTTALHSNGSALEAALSIPALKALRKSLSRQGSAGSMGHDMDYPSHSQPGSPTSSVGTPKVALGRSRFGDAAVRAQSPAIDTALQGASLNGNVSPIGPAPITFHAPPVALTPSTTPVEVYARFPQEQSLPQQQPRVQQPTQRHSQQIPLLPARSPGRGGYSGHEPNRLPHHCSGGVLPMTQGYMGGMPVMYSSAQYLQQPMDSPPQTGLPPPYMMGPSFGYGMVAPQWLGAPMAAFHPQHPTACRGGSNGCPTSGFSPTHYGRSYPPLGYVPAYGLPSFHGSDFDLAAWSGSPPVSNLYSRGRKMGPPSPGGSSHSSGNGKSRQDVSNVTLSSSYPSASSRSSVTTRGGFSYPRSVAGNVTTSGSRGRNPTVQPLMVEEKGEVHCDMLDRFKADKEGREAWKLQDIRGQLYIFCRDQVGSRFVQQALDSADQQLMQQLFEEVRPKLLALMTDVFGNYVVQRFLHLGGTAVQEAVKEAMQGRVVALSLQMYGCRVVQKALEVFDNAGKVSICNELDGHTPQCVRDQNGNHVIQKVIECVQPSDAAREIIESIVAKTQQLSCHTFGCRLVQRVLEYCTIDELRERAIAEVLSNALQLSHDQFGNYVVQHLVTKGPDSARMAVVSKVAPQVMSLAQHKYASNVVEACFRHGSASQRDLILSYVTGEASSRSGAVLNLMKDQFGNYVIQRALEVADEQQRKELLTAIEPQLGSLRKYTYGKHIVARVEAMMAEQAEQTGQQGGAQQDGQQTATNIENAQGNARAAAAGTNGESGSSMAQTQNEEDKKGVGQSLAGPEQEGIQH